MISYIGTNRKRDGVVTILGEVVIVAFTAHSYVWKHPYRFKKCLKYYPFSIVEIDPQDEKLISATASLLDQAFGTTHYPRFTSASLAKIVSDRKHTNCATVALVINDIVASTVGWEFRDYDLDGRLIRLPTLSDGATASQYARAGFATLLNVVAFSRAIEDGLCPVRNGRFLFAITPSFAVTDEFLSDTHLSWEDHLQEVPGALTIMAMREIQGISSIEYGPLFPSTHRPGHMCILMLIYLNPEIIFRGT